MKIYTKTGDEGETSLYSGERVSKSAEIVETYGSVDELNSQLGFCRAALSSTELDPICFQLQRDLHQLAADLATTLNSSKSVDRMTSSQVEALEKLIDSNTALLPELKNFIIPGGSEASCRLHMARTSCRRTERRLFAYSKKEKINAEALKYINRLSDLLFVLARRANQIFKTDDVIWKS